MPVTIASAFCCIVALAQNALQASPISTAHALQQAGAACTVAPHLKCVLPLQPLLQPLAHRCCPTADIYVFCCSYTHNVAPRDKWIAFVSTTVETSDPQSELAPGTGEGLFASCTVMLSTAYLCRQLPSLLCPLLRCMPKPAFAAALPACRPAAAGQD